MVCSEISRRVQRAAELANDADLRMPLAYPSVLCRRPSGRRFKLFGGMGGVVPKSIKVVAFQPPNQVVHATPPVHSSNQNREDGAP